MLLKVDKNENYFLFFSFKSIFTVIYLRFSLLGTDNGSYDMIWRESLGHINPQSGANLSERLYPKHSS